MKWLARTIGVERRRLERARKRFVRKPTEAHLHAVRTTGRRLRSLLEDASDVCREAKLLRRVKRAAKLTDASRDAAVLLALLERTLDEDERRAAAEFLDRLRERANHATHQARRSLARTGFS